MIFTTSSLYRICGNVESAASGMKGCEASQETAREPFHQFRPACWRIAIARYFTRAVVHESKGSCSNRGAIELVPSLEGKSPQDPHFTGYGRIVRLHDGSSTWDSGNQNRSERSLQSSNVVTTDVAIVNNLAAN